MLAAVSGSAAGATFGFLAGSVQRRRAVSAAAPTPLPTLRATARTSRKDAAVRRADLERTAALVGLDVLRDLETAIDAIVRTHKHFPDADGKCPLGLTDGIPARIISRGQDLGRYLTAYAHVISAETDGLLTQVGTSLAPVLSPPSGPKPVRVKGPRRESCPHFEAAVESTALCQQAQATLRDLLYGGPLSYEAVAAAPS
jgi:hypothetical protein